MTINISKTGNNYDINNHNIPKSSFKRVDGELVRVIDIDGNNIDIPKKGSPEYMRYLVKNNMEKAIS